MGVRCFWVEPTGTVYRSLRRYTSAAGAWSCEEGWHQASTPLDEVPATINVSEVKGLRVHWVSTGGTIDESENVNADASPAEFEGHESWPVECEKGCGYRFSTEPGPTYPPARVGDTWQVFIQRVYADADGQKWAMRDLPPGAMFDAHWMPWKGPDGKSLAVILPDNSTWNVDGQASNCTRKGEPHACWVRHGEPPMVTVDKDGDTCAAGAGSIATSGYHGFLRDGELV